MPGTRVETTLRYGGNTLPPGPSFPVDPAGSTLALDVPAGVELLRAELSLQAPGDDLTLELVKGPPAATVVTSAAETVLPASKSADWFTVDWGVRRPLSFLQVITDGTGKQARLKISEGGPWFPPSSLDTVSVGGAGQPLPGVMASRIMVELLPASPVQEVVLRAVARPVDLSATVGKQSPFFLYPLPMQAGQELWLRDELTGALREAWPEDLKPGRVELLLRSSAPGRLRRAQLTLETAAVVRAWGAGTPPLRLTLEPGVEVSRAIDVPTDVPLRGFELSVESELRPERVPLTPAPPPMPEQAQRCAPGRVAAQAFASRAGEVLAGVDLHLRLLSRTARGQVSFHADTAGEPDAEPLASATVPFTLEAQGTAPWEARWVSMDLPAPVPLEEGWWVVLTLTEGVVLWSLGTSPQPPLTDLVPRGGLSREAQEPWQERKSSLGTHWALCRPRFSAPTPPPVPTVLLQWGSTQLPVTPDEEGRLSLDAQALSPLKPTAAQPLKVLIRAPASGELTLSNLRVTSARSDTYPLFNPT